MNVRADSPRLTTWPIVGAGVALAWCTSLLACTVLLVDDELLSADESSTNSGDEREAGRARPEDGHVVAEAAHDTVPTAHDAGADNDGAAATDEASIDAGFYPDGVDASVQPAPPTVVLVSIDGLAPRFIDSELAAGHLPSFAWLQTHAAFTHNARTEARISVTLPNHTSMITGRPAVAVPQADASVHHGWLLNYDPGEGHTIHNAGNPELDYAASVFDETHDRGGHTILYCGKSKFLMMQRSYVGRNSRPDEIGSDDGHDKLDGFAIIEETPVLVDEFIAALTAGAKAQPLGPNFAMLHLADTDLNGHGHGWGSEEYLASLQAMDAALGQIIQVLQSQPSLFNTHLLITTDHGGVEYGHSDPTMLDVVQIPFYVWGPDVEAGDLYALSAGTRHDPGTEIPMDGSDSQPIRNGDAANLALALLRVPPIEGSLHRGMLLPPATETPPD